MDFHSLTRRELQTLCKKNKIPANITNIAMADALSDLQYVEGLDELMMSQEKVAPQTPSIPHSVSRTRDPETAQPLTRSRRTTTRKAVLDQGNKKVVAETPASAASSTSRTRGRKAQVDSSVPVRTRQSLRLLEKTMAELSLKDSKARAAASVIKMDSLDHTVEEHHDVCDKVLQENNSIDDDKKAKNEIVTENAFGETRCVGDTVSDEISDKAMDVVDEEADEREKIIASQQSADPNQLAAKSIAADAPGDTDADDDNDSDSQKPVAIQQDILDVDAEADSNQVASKVSAVDKDADGDDSDSQKSVATNEQQDNADSNQFAAESVVDTSVDDVSDSQNCIAEAVSNQFATESIIDKDNDDDSNSQNFVANQQESSIAEAVSNQFDTESTVDTDTANDSDSENSVANQQGNLIAEADSKQFASKSVVDTEADDDSDSQKSFGNLQDIHIAEAYSNLSATESIAAETETETDADSSATDTDADDDSDSQNSVANQQGNLIAEADSKPFAFKSVVDTEADDGSDSQKSFGNLQDIHIAEAYSNLFATESIAAETETETDADSSPTDTDADDDSGSQKSISDQWGIQTTAAECVEDELFDLSLMEAYEDETPNSNSVKQQISHSSSPPPPSGNSMKRSCDIHVMLSSKDFAMASSPAAIAKQPNCCDSSSPAPTQLEASNQKLAALIQADDKQNIDSSGMILIMKDEESNKKGKVKKKMLKDMSLRELNKMLKEKLQVSNNKKNTEEKNTTTKKQMPRPALQTLPENLMLAGDPKHEN